MGARSPIVSRILFWTGTVTGLCAVAGLAGAWLIRIEPLLPPPNEATCFAGSFSGEDTLRLGYHHERRTDSMPVGRIILSIEHPDGQEPHRDPGTGYGFDWRYSIKLDIASADGARTYRGDGAYCDWTTGLIARVEPALACNIDCDGGSVTLWRVPGRSAIDVIWDADSWLRMSACGGGGAILRAGDTSKTFRLSQAPAGTCGGHRLKRN